MVRGIICVWFHERPLSQACSCLHHSSSDMMSVDFYLFFYFLSQLFTANFMTAARKPHATVSWGWVAESNESDCGEVHLAAVVHIKQRAESLGAGGNVDLELSSGTNGRAEPPEWWGEYGVLSTWGMLSFCCLVIKEAITLCRTYPAPQRHRRNEPPRDVCISQPWHIISFLTFIKATPTNELKYSTSWDNRAFYYSWLLMVNLAFAVALNCLQAVQLLFRGGGLGKKWT